MNNKVIKKLLKNYTACAGIVIILTAIILAIGGANFRPDSSHYANEMQLTLALKPPGFKVNMLLIKNDKPIENNRWYRGLLWGGFELPYFKIPISDFYVQNNFLFYREYSGDPETVFPLKNVSISSLYNPQGLNVKTLIFNKPYIKQAHYWLGTDLYGRDLLSRLLAGTLVSLSVGFIAVIVSLLIGILAGAYAGYYGGRVDKIVSWFVQVIWSIPTLLLVIAITIMLGKGFIQIFLAVGLTMWVEVARVTRGQFLSIREKEFVEAARALGYSDVRIMFKHILPNAFAPLIVISASNFATAILIEAGLSFLGVGAQPPQASWGGMIKDHYGYIVLNKAYLALVPGIAITILVLAFTWLGNGLRDALDSRTA